MPSGLFLAQSPFGDEDDDNSPRGRAGLHHGSGRPTGTPTARPNGSRRRSPSAQDESTEAPASQRQRRVEPARARTHNPFEESSESENEEQDATPPIEVNRSRVSYFFNLLGVEADHEEIANELAEMSRTEQNAALIVCLAGVMKRLDEMARGIGAGPARSLTGNTQVSLMSHEDQVKTHVYTAPFKMFLRHVARQAMLDENIEAYGADHRDNSLYRAVMLQLNMKPGPFKQKHLPPRYLSDDPLATASVVAHVKTHFKHVRHKARNVLLTGIIKNSSRDYIPPITELSRLLWRHFMDGNKTESDDDIDKKLAPLPLLRTRFVFMRMETLHHYIDPSHSLSQWDRMDARLLELRRRPVQFTQHRYPNCRPR